MEREVSDIDFGVLGEMLTPEMLWRRLAHDAFEDPAVALVLAGLAPESPEGAQAEKSASEARLVAVGAAMPALTKVATWLAEMSTKFQTSESPEVMSPEFIASMQEMFFSVIQSALISTFAVFNDLDLIKVTVP